MQIAIFSNLTSVAQGGGGVFIYAIASALAKKHTVTVFHPSALNQLDVATDLPQFEATAQIKTATFVNPRGSREQIRLGWLDRKFDLIFVQSPVVPRLSFCKRTYLLCEFPMTPSLSWREKLRLRTYKRIVANSAYTSHWIKQLWSRESAVLYPPIKMIAPQPKKNWILSVGRFAGGGRSKRQSEMVELFRQMCTEGLENWELHLAGYRQDESYTQQVMAAAAGLPVHFHFNLNRTELEKLYGQSSIYWHATGLDVDIVKHPGRVEHFGISTVEAMSAKCVPIVINRGGQPEIVGRGDAGVLWNSREEWLAATQRMIADEPLRRRTAVKAQEVAKEFAYEDFAERVVQLIV